MHDQGKHMIECMSVIRTDTHNWLIPSEGTIAMIHTLKLYISKHSFPLVINAVYSYLLINVGYLQWLSVSRMHSPHKTQALVTGLCAPCYRGIAGVLMSEDWWDPVSHDSVKLIKPACLITAAPYGIAARKLKENNKAYWGIFRLKCV